MDESFRDFYSRERRVYENTLEEELEKRKFEIENRRMLYYIVRELKLLFPSGINNVLDVGGGAIQGSFANCNNSVDLDLFNEGIIEYI